MSSAENAAPTTQTPPAEDEGKSRKKKNKGGGSQSSYRKKYGQGYVKKSNISSFERAREGEALRVSGLFLKAVVQAVMIFGSETLGDFHTQVTRRLTGRLPRRTPDGRWIYTSTAAARGKSGFLTI